MNTHRIARRMKKVQAGSVTAAVAITLVILGLGGAAYYAATGSGTGTNNGSAPQEEGTETTPQGSGTGTGVIPETSAQPNAPATGGTAQQQSQTASKLGLSVCDGPRLPAGVTKPEGYVPCDFAGLMLQLQRVIDILVILGVLISIVLFSYAGYLYVTGVPGNISKAHDIFWKVLVGFIIMLTAWFIVFQLLSWLTDNAGFKTLLGKP